MKQAKLLTQAELKRVYAVIDAHRYSTRNRAIFAFSFYAGLRACEIAGLRVTDALDSNQRVRDTIFLSAAQTKGTEANSVLVNQRLRRALTAYTASDPTHITDPGSPLFVSAKRCAFSAQTVVNLFARFYALAGIKGASSHSGRRQFLTALADQGVNVRVIHGLPPLKWSSAMFRKTEETHGQQATKARGDCHEVATG